MGLSPSRPHDTCCRPLMQAPGKVLCSLTGSTTHSCTPAVTYYQTARPLQRLPIESHICKLHSNANQCCTDKPQPQHARCAGIVKLCRATQRLAPIAARHPVTLFMYVHKEMPIRGWLHLSLATTLEAPTCLWSGCSRKSFLHCMASCPADP